MGAQTVGPGAVSSLELPIEGREEGLGRLARALASAPSGSGAIFEQTLGRRTVRVTISPGDLVGVAGLRGPGGESGVPYRKREIVSSEGWVVQFGALVRADQLSRSPSSEQEELSSLRTSLECPRIPWPVGLQTLWVSDRSGRVAVARRFTFRAPTATLLSRHAGTVGTTLARDWSCRTGRTYRAVPLPGWRSRSGWTRCSTAGLPPTAWSRPVPERLVETAVGPSLPRPVRSIDWNAGHIAVFGASGAGKTSALSEIAAAAIEAGRTAVVFDLHGDLAPAIAGRLDPRALPRLVALDVTQRPVPGIDVLAGSEPGVEERVAAHFVAGLKRLTPDGEEIYWGFRLERIFDTFVRLVQEEHGTLVDLAALLSQPERREAARWGTRRPELAHFLDELAPVVKRHPDFLWSAATRLSKVLLVPGLDELLAPPQGGISLTELLAEHRSLLVRLPFAEIGPESASLAATLLLTRIYLEVAARASAERGEPPPVLFVLDEAHGFSPRSVTEIATEGRKFGVRALFATQYPERLARESESALAGAVGAHLCFRVPRAHATATVRWLGLRESDAGEMLASLPVGVGVWSGARRETVRTTPIPEWGRERWCTSVEATRIDWEDGAGSSATVPRPSEELPAAAERLVLASSLMDRSDGPGFRPDQLPGGVYTPPERAAWDDLVRRRWLLPGEREGRWRLGPAARAFLGRGRPTGAPRETAEHRLLLEEAARIFARRGCRLEIVRQGRFDTTLPDGRLEIVPRGATAPRSPAEWAVAIDRARSEWAWRFFGGRDVHVEAEVSGALRPERIRRGLAKAARHEAFALFLVGDAARARRVRTVLRAAGLVPHRAQVWTLPRAHAPSPPPTAEGGAPVPLVDKPYPPRAG